MRTTTIVAALGLAVIACGKSGSKSAGPGSGSAAAGPSIASGLPSIKLAAATMVPSDKPPELLVLVDADGRTKLAAGPKSWAWFDTADLAKAKQVDVRSARMLVKEGRVLGQPGATILKNWDEKAPDLLDDSTADPYGREDPPPPEPEDEEEDDDSGGTGTAMTLEEGKMGSKDSDRAEGQYKMRRTTQPGAHWGGCFGALGSLADDHGPQRQCETMGQVATDGKLARPPYAVLLAAPAARVAPLIGLIEDVEVIGVGVDGKVRTLRVTFARERDHDYIPEPPDHWIEVRIWPVGLDIEAVPSAPHSVTWASGSLPADAVAKAYEAALADRKLDKTAAVDVLVSPDTDMQHLVEVLAALDQAGAMGIGIGAVPDKGSPQANLRGARIPRVEISVVDGTMLAGQLRDDAASIMTCYEALLATRSDAAGEVEVTFTVDKAGKASKAAVHGIDATLEGCMESAVGMVKFPPTAQGTAVRALYTLSN